MSDSDRTQFIARTPPPPVALTHRDNDYPRPNDERRSGLIWVAVVAALLLVIGAATYAIFVLGKSDSKTKTSAIPAVVGQLPGPAADAIRQAGFTPRKGDNTNGPCDENKVVDEGKVCVLDPKAGAELKDGSTVTYQLYTPAKVQVPNVVGLTYNEATTQLHDKGLKAKQKAVDSSVPAGQVTAQSKESFAEVAPGTTITLSVSTGKVKLPDVRNKKQADAVTALNTAGWANVDSSQTRTTHTKGQDGTVAAQNPTPGIAYPQSTQITLVIYKFVALEPTCTTPPPTPTVTATATATATATPTVTTPAPGGLPPCPTP